MRKWAHDSHGRSNPSHRMVISLAGVACCHTSPSIALLFSINKEDFQVVSAGSFCSDLSPHFTSWSLKAPWRPRPSSPPRWSTPVRRAWRCNDRRRQWCVHQLITHTIYMSSSFITHTVEKAPSIRQNIFSRMLEGMPNSGYCYNYKYPYHRILWKKRR